MSGCESEHVEADAPGPECGRETVRTSLWVETLDRRNKLGNFSKKKKILATRCHQEPTGLKKLLLPPHPLLLPNIENPLPLRRSHSHR